MENKIDIVMAVEAQNLDISYLKAQLSKAGKYFKEKELLPKHNGILFLVSDDIAAFVYKEEKYFSAYKVHMQDKNYLLVVTHLSSAMYCSELARNQRACELAKIIEKLEETCNMEAKREGMQRYGTIVAGDFNLHPFSAGIVSVHGFHAIMDLDKSLEGSRIFQGNKVRFYYNPMWNLMGKRGNPLGTYYYETDQDDNSFYWYTYDQILLRPELMTDFIWEEFAILDQIDTQCLIKNRRIYRKKYSDHLPIKFEIGYKT